ncbi:hypothetical protein [Acetobacter sacchari]|uniref:hypothetical protein n=1 Tax=Acetobacter sacchari TaxID=2661687 RepID=UPI001FAF0672|nr:hypothetical protein [Acetobacter sacchari]
MIRVKVSTSSGKAAAVKATPTRSTPKARVVAAPAKKISAISKRKSSPARAKAVEEVVAVEVAARVPAVREALYFDAQWYLDAYPDVNQAGVDPASHYRESGFREGRQPNAAFNGKAYIAANPDLAGYENDPFMHYVFFGAAEGRPLS